MKPDIAGLRLRGQFRTGALHIDRGGLMESRKPLAANACLTAAEVRSAISALAASTCFLPELIAPIAAEITQRVWGQIPPSWRGALEIASENRSGSEPLGDNLATAAVAHRISPVSYFGSLTKSAHLAQKTCVSSAKPRRD